MDLVCREDLDPFAAETDDEEELLAQDLEHRLLEEYGSNPDDEDRGVGLLSRLSGTDSPTMVARLIEADFANDDRVLSCEASVERIESNGNAGSVAKLDIMVTTTERLLKLGYEVLSDGHLTGGVVA